ncbi:ATP-dependent DNA helicase RecG [Virgibacillus natechei]|uniref:ATP-dependent DNA helicase RecG n=1 Tax=Virgibacillus natechei TaxID=1216297 RepID=A0ABS4IIS9_9BACI|nr:RNA-binding domain-containing protein [Virgibacillus natechei]MBP1970831.1 ATP-dependent DNA helicase RecG [Virgibacillus natechei]UZD12277.1 putative DNA binding domain-containing protein [Virgibacillus natechei]
MTMKKLQNFLRDGESIITEFKQSSEKLNKDVFESVCAFLNRNGGHLFLGVADDGKITGVNEDAIEKVKKDFVTSMNNPQKISPTFYLSVEEIKIGKKRILYIFVPESSQVHRCNGKIFDRNEDGDLDITDNTNQVSAMYMRKQGTYSENRIFPFAELSDLKSDLFIKVRKLAENQRTNHPWKLMDDLELLKSAGLYLKDLQSGKEGITLAAILLLGKDDLIISALPHYRTDAILRRDDIDRYDDRDDIRTNLVDSYERLMQFIAKHLNDKFYLEKDQRVSLRDTIFREVVSNILVHREFSNPFPAKLVIEKERVFVENSNKPHGNGIIDPANFSPFPKNPTIAKFFKEIGRVDELGSGVRNIYKYNKVYSGADPAFIEGDVFKTIIPLIPRNSDQAGDQAGDQVSDQDDRTKEILEFCQNPKSRSEIQEFLGIKSKRYFRANVINPLIKGGLIKLTIPDKPTSPKQKYQTANR